ncbi:MAG: cytochrome c [Gammaproteobacteria bacterium]|nr:cytochrome c [Gammaproteobacteria bacterium]MCY4358092.1 cytochrome c [Gammaproteobacteria bacterium]
MIKPQKINASVLVLTGLLSVQSLLAQEKTVNDGVFTQEQVNAGQVVYDSQCRTCHNKRFYRDTLRSWNNQPLLYLWETIMGTMPADNPGSLMFEEYTDVIAFILHEQGFPAGESKLDPDNGMEQISILSP